MLGELSLYREPSWAVLSRAGLVQRRSWGEAEVLVRMVAVSWVLPGDSRHLNLHLQVCWLSLTGLQEPELLLFICCYISTAPLALLTNLGG